VSAYFTINYLRYLVLCLLISLQIIWDILYCVCLFHYQLFEISGIVSAYFTTNYLRYLVLCLLISLSIIWDIWYCVCLFHYQLFGISGSESWKDAQPMRTCCVPTTVDKCAGRVERNDKWSSVSIRRGESHLLPRGNTSPSAKGWNLNTSSCNLHNAAVSISFPTDKQPSRSECLVYFSTLIRMNRRPLERRWHAPCNSERFTTQTATLPVSTLAMCLS
jgi:hypothetical protein